MTAVGWLEKRLLGIVYLDTEYSTIEYEKIINKAKEMEKQQNSYSEEDMKKAFENGMANVAINNFEFDVDTWFKQFKKK